MADIPGVNPIAAEQIARVVEMTCETFRSSAHGNAYPRTTGEMARCDQCREPQWKHWLRQLMAAVDGLAREAAVSLGRRGGLAGKGKTSPAKVAAARANGQKGGRPPKPTPPEKTSAS